MLTQYLDAAMRRARHENLKDDVLTASLVNVHATQAATVDIEVRGRQGEARSCRVLTAEDIHDCNDFDAPDRVRPVEAPLTDNRLTLPPASVVVAFFALR